MHLQENGYRLWYRLLNGMIDSRTTILATFELNTLITVQ